jgi:methyl-accepting chemotaxis protein
MDTVMSLIEENTDGGARPLKELVTTWTATAAKVDAAATTFNRVAIQIENAEIPRAIANGLALLPSLFEEAQATLGQTQRTLKGFEQFSASLEGLGKEFDGIGETIRKVVENANVAIENIAEITEPVSQNSEQIVAKTVQSLDSLSAVADDLRRLTYRLNNSNGTVAQLIDNPQLYMKANEALRDFQVVSGNLNVLSQKAIPIANDFRSFSDKIARNPGALIDLKGVISGRPRGIGLK